MSSALAWTLRAVGLLAGLVGFVRLAEWRIERWVIGKTRVLP